MATNADQRKWRQIRISRCRDTWFQTGERFVVFRSKLDRELENYEKEQRQSAQYVEQFSILTSEKVQ